MSTVEGKKQEKRRALLDAAYELFLERGTAKTSVEDITSRAKVAKGTFYLYFQDKGAVMQALLGRVSYQLLNNACEAVERQTGLETFPDKMVAVIDHIIEALRRDTVVLKFLERNFVWPGRRAADAQAAQRGADQPGNGRPHRAGGLSAHHGAGQHVHVGVLLQHSGGQAGQHRQHETGAVRHHPQGAVRNFQRKLQKALQFVQSCGKLSKSI